MGRNKQWNNLDATCMDDCIHLKACRRLQKMVLKKHGEHIARHCDTDCTAYQTIVEIANEKGYYTDDQVYSVLRGACMDGKNGYYPGDLMISDYIV